MKIDILTVLPELLESPLNHSIMKRAQEKNLLTVRMFNLRKWAINDYGQVDDYQYGGGAGMVMMCEPLANASTACLPSGMPSMMSVAVYPIEVIQTPKQVTIVAEAFMQVRRIFMDQPQQNIDDVPPGYFGRSVGKWEGDTLVVDSKGFHDRFWFSNGGLPHTPQLHLIERYSRPDLYTLQYEVTIDDPGAYTRPWVSSWTLRWVPDEELPVYFCQDNRP